MLTTFTTTRCACSASACAWVSHASVGQRCENVFQDVAAPPAWATIPEMGLCCPSCNAIHQLRENAPVEPIRWNRQRGSFSAFLEQ